MAAESTVATRISAPSFDVADFPVPHGREEEWRFTPLERLRGLHDGTAVAPDDDVGSRSTLPRASPSRPSAATTPAARQGRACPVTASPRRRRGPREGLRVTVPDDAVLAEPVRGSPCTARAATPTPTTSSRSARSPRPIVVLDHTRGRHPTPPTSSSSSATAPSSTVVSVQDWDDNAVHVAQHNALVGRDATFKHVVVTFGGDVVRLTRASTTPAPAARPSCSACTSPTPASTRSTGCSSTTTSPQPQATWPTRARCRARARTRCGSATCSSARGRGHRHLRDEPQPGPHRRLPGRLGAEPRDRDRRDRRRRATRRRPAASTTSSCSTCSPAASRRTRPVGWSCAASSPSWSADRRAGDRGAPAREDRGRAGGSG